ncbi:MAG: ROK family protein [Myxococcales bacterium FL481]|nr:MAG: ROK family protein [Myxococcales bacterium FL481]
MRIGIDLGGTKIEGVALGPNGEIAERLRVPTPKQDYSAVVQAVADLVGALEQRVGRPCTVGIGTPGSEHPERGIIRNANTTAINGHPFRNDLEQALKREIRLANDANCLALSEAVDGAASGAHVVFGVILGTGVGGALVVGGRLLVGRNAIAGEWGHNPLPWPTDDERPGPTCSCGRTGCIETFLSGPGLVRDAAIDGLVTAEAVVAAAATDGRAANALARYEQRLARAFAQVINLVDPDVIVVGGGVSNVSRLYDAVVELWQPYVFCDSFVDTPVRPAQHGDSSGVRGAAWLWHEPSPAAPA